MRRLLLHVSWVLAVLALPFVLPTYMQYVACLTLVNILAITGLNLLMGYCGQISLGQAGFQAVGAYTAALVADKLGLGFVGAVLASALLAGLAGVVLGLLVLRLEGPYLAVATLAFGAAVPEVATNWSSLTGGPGGLAVATSGLLSHYIVLYVLLLAVVALVFWLMANVFRSRFGRGVKAVKDNSIVAQTLGIDVTVYRVVVFAASAALTGVSGALLAYLTKFISPDEFGFWSSIDMLAAVVVGGAGWLYGPIFGGLIITVVPQVTANLQSLPALILGAVLFLSLQFVPGGLAEVVELLLAHRTRLGRMPAGEGGTREVPP